ncbi:DUF2790 domain-containing protein [Pseudomonas alliivorans]|uniref:DUF2790 domain-containing protein n=1 Tax=Pseudomonas cannabina pv. alisalensis TaxID=757414 RepID=A0ABS1X7V1_PSEC1|nr:DUF2790 domain-containing protein [Pseudomonas cannabina]MEE4964488.1 DUF2790 domain-containing protein [Pseudomonas alliivorans]MBM0137548.1 DUF2790 domain-containing protein [Pseudomonas cannabina pv. alisalensis]MEE4974571.1 DUF2790 domain-containing protein [Pseudomonas alliivorans]MEE4979720.1 DUF2790 domain-containing protein [Pseudomonas alliivorans]MEE4984827.1 DUF2790 domain-containing protein [Pseudomonas alliivorans]
MNTVKCFATLLILAASSAALADGGSDRLYGKMIQENEQDMRTYAAVNGENPPEVIHYRYGMKLDVAKVISMTSTKASCDVMPAQMNYENSSGELKILEYRTIGTGCLGKN